MSEGWELTPDPNTLGPQGDKGDTGAKGDTGIQGIPGTAASKGDTGDKGDTGAAGAKGDTGDDSTVPGPKGDTGAAGGKGDTGTQGGKGDTGTKGDTGDQGDTGADSTVPGPQGDTGDPGDTGSAGAKGDTGSAGAKGDTGTAGAKGDTGTHGDTGAGSDGAKGDTGTAGAKGDTGTAGDTGAGSAANFGTAVLDFGASPGSSQASVDVTGQTDIEANSPVWATVSVVATEHSADEVILEPIHVECGAPTAGVGFTIYGTALEGLAVGTYTVSWSYGVPTATGGPGVKGDTGVTGPTGSVAFLLSPEAASFPTANFPQLKKYDGTNHSGYTLGFDTTTGESAFWKFKIPTTVTFTAATIKIVSRQLAAVTGTLGWVVKTLNRVDNDAYDTAGNSDTVTASTVKATAGKYLFQTKALTVTGWAAGDVIQVQITRDVANDSVAEDGEFVFAEIELS